MIDSHPVGAGTPPQTAQTAPKPPVESSLVGDGKGAGPASRKAAPGESQPADQPAEAASARVPPVTKAAPAQSQTPKSEPEQPAIPQSAGAGAEPVKSETRVVEVRKAGFMPTFLGGVIAAALGAGAAYWAIPKLPAAWQPAGSAAQPSDEAPLDAARDAGAEAARAEFQAQLDALTARAAEAGAEAARQALADAPPPAAPPAAPAADSGALQAQQDQLAALESAVAELAARPVVAPVVSGEGDAQLQAVLEDLTAGLARQQQRIDELAARPAQDAGLAEEVQGLVRQAQELQVQITAAADQAQQRIAAAEAQAATLQESVEAANRRAQAATAAAALQAAIETGGARDQALADLAAAGVEPPAVLTGDVPTLEQLRAEFPAAAREGLAASLKVASDGEGALGTIGNFLRVQTGARSVEPRAGNDPDAVLSRADAAVKAGDIPGALAEIAALPQPGQDAMSGWTGRAQTWIEANAALSALAAGSM
ncbi:COG4223 family protein [Paracoccus halophilus]|uniref:COG4223 family protein n=1 Tax=Paracoccus halophilus TaxID=376733 RepID=UPI000AD7C3FE|nr:hypothetical protein [Paracoccus halophilus]